MLNAEQIAEYILTHYSDKKITPMKLQKLVYYVKVWALVAGFPDVDASFQAWKYGPVNVELYEAYKQFGNQVIPAPSVGRVFEQAVNKQLNFILDNYAGYSAFELSVMTHSESPWLDARLMQVISDQKIYDFYSQQPFAKNFEGQDRIGFFPVQSESWHAFVMDMDESDSAEFEQFNSYDTYRANKKQAEAEFSTFLETTFNIPRNNLQWTTLTRANLMRLNI